MKRLWLAVLAGVVVFGAIYAVATTLTLDAAGLASGSDSVEPCDNSFSFSFTRNSNDEITQVTIGGIAPECGGGALSLTLTNSSNVAVGGGVGTVPLSGGSLVVPIAAQPATVAVYHEYVSIVGP
jgi:hypothetical protein